MVEEYDKKRALYEVLEKVMDGSKVLIFTSTKRTADELTASLRADGWPARAIHGDMEQREVDSRDQSHQRESDSDAKYVSH